MIEYSGLEAALALAVEELEKAAIPYMLIGGLALSAWGIPRATLDVDLTLWVAAEDLDNVCARLTTKFVSRTTSPDQFVQRTRVLPVTTDAGDRIDFIFAAFPFEKTMIERASKRPLGGVFACVATLEDLILLKLPSSRTKDRQDVDLILGNHGWELLAEALYQPHIAAFLRARRGSLE